MATSPDGFVFEHGEHGLWIYQSRALCRYRWLINGRPPLLAGNSNIEQHSWLGYYIAALPNAPENRFIGRNPAQQTIELRISRQVGPGLHEDVDVANFTQIAASITLELEVDSDFADPKEAAHSQSPTGQLQRIWSSQANPHELLRFDYRAKHSYDHQGEKGTARLWRVFLSGSTKQTLCPNTMAITFASKSSSNHMDNGALALDGHLISRAGNFESRVGAVSVASVIGIVGARLFSTEVPHFSILRIEL